MKKADANTALAAVRPNQKFSPRADPLPRAQDGQNLISCRRSLPLLTNPVWWGSMYAILSYHGNRPIHIHAHTHAHPPTNRQDRLQYIAPQLERSVINEWMNLHPQWQGTSQALYSLLSTSSARHFANFSRTVNFTCTCIQVSLRCYNYDSTAIHPPFYSYSTENIRLRYDHSTTYTLRPYRHSGINKRKSARRDANTACWLKAEPKIFAPPKTTFPGAQDGQNLRSEERRVGKECRSRWSPYH